MSAADVVAASHDAVRPGDVVRVYVAAPRVSAREAHALVLALRSFHFPCPLRVVSRWINRCVDDPADPVGEDERSTILANNVIDIGWADVVVALMHRGTPRATMGDIVWALANETPVVWIASGDDGRNIGMPTDSWFELPSKIRFAASR